jgi:hypothetical protein
MATSAERMKALRERERRGLRRFTVPVSEDDLRVMAKHGYGGALSMDHEQQAQAVTIFITDVLAARLGKVTASRRLQRRFSKGCHHRCNAVSVVRKVVSAQFRCRVEGRGQVCAHSADVLDCGLDLGTRSSTPTY